MLASGLHCRWSRARAPASDLASGPLSPILQDGEKAFAMFKDLQNKYDWVLKVSRYASVDRLVEVLEDKIVRPAEAKFNELLARRTKQLRVENV